MYDGRVESDAELVEAGHFRKYEDGLLWRRGDFGGNSRFGREGAGEFQTTTTKSANRLLEGSTGGKRSGEGKGKSPKGGDSKEGDSKEMIPKEKSPTGKKLGGKDSKGKDSKGKDRKGGKTLPKVEEDLESTGISYSSQTTRLQKWGGIETTK